MPLISFHLAVLQSREAVTAYLKSKTVGLHLAFAQQLRAMIIND